MSRREGITKEAIALVRSRAMMGAVPAADLLDEVMPLLHGETLRDRIAMAALPAVIAATSAGQHRPPANEGDTHTGFAIAREAYSVADAMLKTRKEDPK